MVCHSTIMHYFGTLLVILTLERDYATLTSMRMLMTPYPNQGYHYQSSPSSAYHILKAKQTTSSPPPLASLPKWVNNQRAGEQAYRDPNSNLHNRVTNRKRNTARNIITASIMPGIHVASCQCAASRIVDDLVARCDALD